MATDRIWLLCDLCLDSMFSLLKHVPLSPARRLPSATEGSLLGRRGLLMVSGSRKMFEPHGAVHLVCIGGGQDGVTPSIGWLLGLC